ncbi:MAG: hypothetical protein KGH65_04960 [Candidatus Micrarchaeota archaeon]|nr:hypothetical protein [Candidatus Micrarchaeota archaeon]
MALLPPVVATLLADTKEYSAKMDQAQAKMDAFGKSADGAGGKFSSFANKASNAVIGVGVAFAGYAIDKAYKFQEALDQIQRQTGLTSGQMQVLKTSILSISDQTATSTSDLANASLTIEQAGIRGAKGMTLLRDAAKAAVITNSDVISTTQALIAAQSLQIARGMDVTKLTGILVAGSKQFVGGLAAEEAMLQGRVGVALANYGLHLKDVIGLGAVFAKVHLPSRSIASFTTGLANLEKPLTTTKGKLTTYAQNLEKVGLSQTKLAADLKTGNIVGLLDQISRAAQRGGGPLSQYVNAVFGSGGGSAASVLIKNLQTVKDTVKSISGAGAGSLQTSFGLSTQQLGFKMKELRTQFDNAMTGAGLILLPTVTMVANWAEGVVRYFDEHPLVRKIASDAAIATFAAAVAYKIGKGLIAIVNTIRGVTGSLGMAKQITQGETQITLLGTIAENTGIMAGKSGLGAGAGAAAGAGAGSDVAEAGAVAGISAVGGVAAIAALAVPIAAATFLLPKNATAPAGFSGRFGVPVSRAPGGGHSYGFGPRGGRVHKTVTVRIR